MRSPRATYRLQLHAGFGFDDGARVAPYLQRLGVSHAYCSPYLQAAPGSTHGYDVVDHSRVNAELGGEEGHARFCKALVEHRLGQVLDIVPNHMAIGTPENRWWWDVLESGPASPYAKYFDVDWEPPELKLRHTVLLPILGDHYGRELESGAIQLAHEGGAFTVRYHEQSAPVAPESLAGLLSRAADVASSPLLAGIAAGLRRLPAASGQGGDSRRARQRYLERLRERLAAACRQQEVSAAIDEVVADLNRHPDDLDAILEAQHYRLARWRTAARELDYRRFFDVNTLVGLRVEDPDVFADTHARVLDWLDDGTLDGVRVDHPDGLRRPADYFERLHDAAPGAWIVAEKILESGLGETLPGDWLIDGTTGYDFLNDVLVLLIDPAGFTPLHALAAQLTGDDRTFDEVVHEAKRLVLHEMLGSDVQRLTQLFVAVCEGHRRHRDHTRHELHEAVQEVLASFEVYRTYVDEGGSADERDVAVIDAAIIAAAERRPDIDEALLTFIGKLLRGAPEVAGPLEDELRMRFQQTTGPVMAKSVEDTAFYRYVANVVQNEVGGRPGPVTDATALLHARSEQAAALRPRSMLALSTHDTKRSEDVRARLALLSEMPDEWSDAVHRWVAMNEKHRSGPGLPDHRIELLLYQTLVGAHPITPDRVAAYVEKASREAKLHTSWTDPVPEYDEALVRFIEATLADAEFVEDLERFVRPLIEPGWVNALAQKLVQLTSPGVPDLYQGTELWDLSLVDPDNRRPVDYARRGALLDELEGGLDAATAWSRAEEGLPKLLVVHRALEARNRLPVAFDGDYVPLRADGPAAEHLFGFVRGGEVITVVPRLVLGLDAAGGWKDTTVDVPMGQWTNVLTSERARGGAALASDLLADFPVALLTRS